MEPNLKKKHSRNQPNHIYYRCQVYGCNEINPQCNPTRVLAHYQERHPELVIPKFDATNHGYHFFEEGDTRIRLLSTHWDFFDAETKAFIARKILVDHDEDLATTFAPIMATTGYLTVASEIQEPEIQEPEIQEPVMQEPEIQEPEMQEPVMQEPEMQEPEAARHRETVIELFLNWIAGTDVYDAIFRQNFGKAISLINRKNGVCQRWLADHGVDDFRADRAFFEEHFNLE